MNKSLKIILYTFLVLSLHTPLFSQSEYQVTHLTVEDGLPSRNCFGGFMDEKGYMWIATDYGLSRYNGISFKNYLFDFENPETLGSYGVKDILGLSEDVLLVLSGNCLYRFYKETETIEATNLCFKDSENQSQIGLLELSLLEGSTLWISALKGGFFKYDIAQDSFKQFNLVEGSLNPREQFDRNKVNCIRPYIGDKNKLWIGGSALYIFDKKTESLVIKCNHHGLHGIYSKRKGEVWFGAYGSGYWRLDEYTGEIEKFKVNKAIDFGPNTMIYAIEEDSDHLWIASERGPMLFNTNSKEFTFPTEGLSYANNADENNINRLLKDDQNRLWAFTWNGIKIYDRQSLLFKTYTVPRDDINRANSRVAISGLDVESTGEYWLTGYRGKVFYKINQDRSHFTPQSFGFPFNLQNKSYEFYDVLIDSHDDIWLNKSMIYKFNRPSNQLEPFKEEQLKKIGRFNLYHSVEAPNGDVYWGTSHNGLIRYDRKRDTIIQYLNTPNNLNTIDKRSICTNTFFDHMGRLWLSTDTHNIYIFDPKTEAFTDKISVITRDSSIQFKTPKALLERNPNEILINTRGAVFFMNQSGEIIERIKDDKGVPLENAFGAVKDNKEGIWILNTLGLHHLDTLGRVSSYGEKEGINELEGWNTKIKRLRNGEIFIGKKNNTFHLFHPDSLPYNNTPPEVVFDEIRVNRKPLKLSKNINYLNEITLDFEQNFFSISFAALNFTRPDKNQYAYKMEGLHDSWIMNGNENKAAFTNLREGNYTFRVKATNNDGVWNNEGISIKIKILPPWHRSTLACLIYLGLIGGGLFLFWNYQNRRRKLQRQLQLEQAEAIRLKELDETKNRLYTNITHEFRTPLTVISGLADGLDGNNIKKKKILENSKSLLHLVNQMLDLSKLESGQLKYEPILFEVISFLNYLTDSFSSLSNEKRISLNFHSDLERLEMDVDVEKLKLIIGNLISNAIKFTPEFGRVLVTAQQEKKELVIRIKDNGIGIPSNEISKIFDRFYQVNDKATREGEGTGIGLAIVKEISRLMKGTINVKSEVNKGSEFMLTLPITKNASVAESEVYKKQGSEETINSVDDASDISTEFTKSDETITKQNNVLIIEDNSDVAFYIQSILNHDYNTAHMRNGRLGIDQAIESIPDLILCDVMMPEVDGFEVCSILKKDERTSHIPIIMLTAKATQKDKLEGLKHGADAYLIKPFDKQELLVRVKQLMKRQTQLQKYYSKNDALPTEQQVENEFLKKVISVIEENYSDEDFDLTRLCRAVHLERTQLYRKVKALTDISPSGFIRKIRIEKAHEFLKSSNAPIAEIAFKCGFKNTSHFSKIYKDHFGTSPNATRK